MDHHDQAAALATGDPRTWEPGCGYPFVMYRQYFPAAAVSPQQMVDLLGGILNTGNHNVVLTLVNEWEGLSYDPKTYAGMKRFCEWSLDTLLLLRSRGFYNVALLSSSTGTPEFTNDGVCAAIREVWAPKWNDGTIRWIDMHNYSPTMAHILDPDSWCWHERRWEFLFTKCGFDPEAPGWIISGETGVDEGGSGGFVGHGASAEQLVDWTRRHIAAQQRPLIVKGLEYPTRYKVGMIFQATDPRNDKGCWGSYYIGRPDYLAALKASRWGQA